MLTSYDLKSCTRPLTICTVASYSLIKHPSILYNKNYYLFFLTFLYDNKGRKSYLTTVHYTLYTIHAAAGLFSRLNAVLITAASPQTLIIRHFDGKMTHPRNQ